VVAVDLRALTREEGEAEGRREEQSSASGGEGSRAGHPERGGGKQSSHSCGRAVVWRRNSSGERRRQEGKEHMVCLVGWASPLLTRLLSFSFFSFPFFFIYCSKLLFSFFN